MDPRHPELALPRVKELVEQYERVERDINASTTNAQLSQLSREGALVVQEIAMVSPRLHEGMSKALRNRRAELARGILAFNNEVYTPPNQAETEIAVIKPRKKKTKRSKK